MHVIRKSEFTDIEIIQKILGGESAVFELLVRRYNPYLYKLGRSYGYSHQDTEDLMQEAFISAYLSLSSFESRASFKAWLIRIMLNKCYHKQQKFSSKYEVSSELPLNGHEAPMFSDSDQFDTFKTVMKRELNYIVECALKEIPLDYRTVFALRELDGLSVAETAEVLSITEDSVKVRLFRAKRMLRTEVEKVYRAEDIFEFNLIYCDTIVSRVMEEIERLNKP